ncbi:MAG: MBL fold metallo-hydrolase, partial [Pseudomonadota bacterium]
LPTDAAKFFFTPTIVNTGSDLVLFDTGLSGESITEVLAEAGYTPDMVTKVVITHMHGDHIGGLMTAGAPTFPNASYITAAREFDAWSKMDNERFQSNVAPLAEQMTMIEDGASGFSGHTAMAAYGHTPGHMIHMIESAGQSLVLIADLANHYVWSLAYPEWEVRFDMDKEAAAATRRRVLDMLATDNLPFVGYHMPWPATGYVETRGDGFAYVPTSYQFAL